MPSLPFLRGFAPALRIYNITLTSICQLFFRDFLKIFLGLRVDKSCFVGYNNVAGEVTVVIDFTGVKVMLARRHMTQKELAEQTGVRYDTISKISLGTISRVPVDALDKICTVLSCQPGDLIEHVPDPPEGSQQ